MSSKNVLLGCGIAFGAVVVVLGALAAVVNWVIIPKLLGSHRSPSFPPQLAKPGVITGAGRLTKSVYLKDKSLGVVSDIVMGELDPAAGKEIGIADYDGAVFIDTHARSKSYVSFPNIDNHVEIIDIQKDGICEFLSNGSWGSAATVLDHTGKQLWTYDAKDGIDDMATGDVDGDGELEFAVGLNGGGGIHLLDSSGKQRWQKIDANVWHVEMIDVNGDGHDEIIHSNAMGEITVRDEKGNKIINYSPEAYCSDFSLCKWPASSTVRNFLYAEDNNIWVYDSSGTQLAKYSAPYAGSQGTTWGTSVRLKAGVAPYLAAVVTYNQEEKSALYLYDSTGVLQYQEVIDSPCEAIAVLPSDNGKTDTLLLGGKGLVWQYAWKAQ